MPRTQFNDRWKIWIWQNVSNGCPKDEVFKTLLEHGFDYEAIRNELSHDLTNARNVQGPPFWTSIACDRASALGRMYLPGAEKLPSSKAELYTLEAFLNRQECDSLMEFARANLFPSGITTKDEPDKDFRTSRTCPIGTLQHPLVQDVDRRMCALMGLNPSYSETLQVQYYGPGQQFKSHTDAFAPDTREFDEHGGEQGQRTWTFMVYLNDVAGGGETEFPDLGVELTPRAGLGVIWNNLYPDGSPNPHTLHWAKPVLEGYKATMTKWFRARPAGRMHVKQPREYIPSLTATGFEKRRIPEDLFHRLREYHDQNVASMRADPEPPSFVRNGDGTADYLIDLPHELGSALADWFKAALEEWSGEELVPVDVDAIRRYVKGTVVLPHADKSWSQIVSAVLVVDQELAAPWMLQIEDHQYRTHELSLAPGEVLFYEGARLLHGRPVPLDGEYCSIVPVHYRPSAFNR